MRRSAIRLISIVLIEFLLFSVISLPISQINQTTNTYALAPTLLTDTDTSAKALEDTQGGEGAAENATQGIDGRVLASILREVNISRSTANRELSAFIPAGEGNYAINISIGGTKIEMSLVNYEGSIIKKSEEYSYKRIYMEQFNEAGSINEKRAIFFSILVERINTFISEIGRDIDIDTKSIELIGISWPGNVLSDYSVGSGGVPGFHEGQEARTRSYDLMGLLKREIQ